MIVAIDGLAGSGKSTTARLVARRLGYKYIDSGATYRVLALLAKRKWINPKNEHKVTELSGEVKLDFNGDSVFLDGEDVTEAIRDEEVGKLASLCSTYKGVRDNMVALQRRLASPLPRDEERNVICEGRDIGTVVFPDAEIKIYMSASLNERAKRRKLELENMGVHKPLNEIKEDLRKRDLQDMGREHSPLRVPEGAIVIDTTDLSIEEEVDKVIKIIKDSR